MNGCPIAAFRILGYESPEAPEHPRLPTKWELIQAIKTQSQAKRQLREADLSDADLRGANLSEAVLRSAFLSGTDLSGAFLRSADLREAVLFEADLRGADLRGAFLSRANLFDADLSGTDLSDADLRGAFLSRVALRDAVVVNAQFGQGIGLSQAKKQDLAMRGAIFDDASGDRESMYAPIHR
ncbi:MAG: pentapeptide repeat-containing protein [Scytolyngbya sp. HA4215-MV1]|nr:pentapeptide repeat-containing protein [Scytolyngbya sp. HA4215-MV1]